jgi:hypothetical protein
MAHILEHCIRLGQFSDFYAFEEEKCNKKHKRDLFLKEQIFASILKLAIRT